MITRTCQACKIADIVATKDNVDGAVFFEGKYYHKNCFIDMCQQKIGNKRCKKNWQGLLDNIVQWQDEARQAMKLAIDKDDVYNFLIEHYRISCTNNALFTRLSSIYDGTYHGLVYPISPEELLAEWKFYFPELEAKRKGKNMSGAQAIPYDLAVLLSKNAEYREIMKKKKIEELVREAQKNTTVEINISALQGATNIARGNRARAQLYDDFMGGDV